MSNFENRREEYRELFEKEILTRPIIFDNDFDGLLCMAFINSVLKKNIEIAGIKYRYRDKQILKENGINGNTCLGIISTTPWEECSFIDFEVHNCYSVGHHYLLKHGDKMVSPNKQFNIDGKKSNIFVQKYPMSTLIYLIYLYDKFNDFTDKQKKYLAICDKTFQNSWPTKIYNDPYIRYLYDNEGIKTPRYACSNCNKRKSLQPVDDTQLTLDNSERNKDKWLCNEPNCQTIQEFLLKGYRGNFENWVGWMRLDGFTTVLDDQEFYYKLFEEFPHIFGKYPPADHKGLELISLILKNLGWDFSDDMKRILDNEYNYSKLYLIPEFKKAPMIDRIPKDIFHHAKLDIRHITISRISEIKEIDL